jgi:hypothetical protein
MVELTAPNGVTVMASDEDAPRMLASGYKPKQQPKRRAPRKAQKPQEK